MVSKGTRVKFICDSKSSPKWYLNHGPTPLNTKAVKNELQISSANNINIGSYECFGVANNSPHYSYFSASASLKLKGNY